MIVRDGAAARDAADGPRLAGRRCVVTGAARGIGAEIARTYVRAGATVALLDVSADVKALAAELDGPAEVADLADVQATRDALGRLVRRPSAASTCSSTTPASCASPRCSTSPSRSGTS